MAVFEDLSKRGPSQWGLRVRGLAVIGVVAAVLTGYQVIASRPPADREQLTIITSDVGDGLRSGADVRMRGMVVGSVNSVEVAESGAARIALSVDADRVGEIATPMTPRFVSANIFGKTAVELDAGAAASGLRGGQVIVLGEAMGNHTVTSLIRDAGTTVLDVVTPELTDSIKRASRLITETSPAVNASLELTRAWRSGFAAQQVDLGRLVRSLADATSDSPKLIRELIGGLYDIAAIPVFGDPVRYQWYLDTFAALGGVIGDRGLGAILLSAGKMLPALETMGDFLGPLTHSMRNLNARQLHELIARLDRALPMVDGRPALNVAAAMSLMPGMVRPGGGR